MRKHALTLMTVFCFATVVINAQTYVGTVNADLPAFGIPGTFTNSGHTFICCSNENGSITVYDNDYTTCIANIEGIDLMHDDDIICDYTDLTETGININGHRALVLTQSLFNSDNSFEYIEELETCWNIKSTDGSIIQTINVDSGHHTNGFGIVKMDNIFYLHLVGRYQGQGYGLVYRIDAYDGLTKVDVELPLSVFPTMADRSQQITVELGEGNNAKEITVVNSLGQVVKHVPVEEGQREITIPASDLGTGLNVVNTRSEQGQGSCKIIVR